MTIVQPIYVAQKLSIQKCYRETTPNPERLNTYAIRSLHFPAVNGLVCNDIFQTKIVFSEGCNFGIIFKYLGTYASMYFHEPDRGVQLVSMM